VGYFSKIDSIHDAKVGATALECFAAVLSLNHYRPLTAAPVLAAAAPPPDALMPDAPPLTAAPVPAPVERIHSPAAPADAAQKRRKIPRPEPRLVRDVQTGAKDPTPAMLSRDAAIELQQTDPSCNAITRALQEDILPRDSELALHLMASREWYAIEEDALLVHFHTSHPKRGQVLKQWVVPPALRTIVLRLAHDDASAGHAGVGATTIRILER
jgi:hypothetical protein